MLPFRQILFPVDFSDSCRAMAAQVMQVATEFQCPVTLLHCYQLPVAFYGELAPVDLVIPANLRGAQESLLRQFAAEHLPGLPHQQITLEGETAEEIHKFVIHNGTDLIMMPTTGRGPLRRLLLGSVVSKVLHDVSVPVWTSAHASEPDAPSHWPVRSVLCAVSLEEESEAIVRAAAVVAGRFGARLSLFHATGYPQPAIDVDYEFYRKQLVEIATQRLQSLRWDLKLDANIIVCEGSAVQCIRRHALAVSADLVVLGRGHAQGVISRLWSDLYDVIRESPCPVLSI
jgi:nucleotide-binding universal stress UspA family protein